MNKALFLDRDGVINVDHGHVGKKENFEFVEGIFKLVTQAIDQKYLVIVITNQAGIGRGLYTEDDFHLLTKWMTLQFELNGGRIEKVYYCPNHPTKGIGKYKKNDSFRKPGPGMFLQAKDEFCLDMRKSILIGDKASDLIAGTEAGVGQKLLLSNQSFPELNKLPHQRIYRLEEAIDFL